MKTWFRKTFSKLTKNEVYIATGEKVKKVVKLFDLRAERQKLTPKELTARKSKRVAVRRSRKVNRRK